MPQQQATPGAGTLTPTCTGLRRSCGGMTPGALARVQRYIDERLPQRIFLPELAQIARLSERHFSRAFRQSTGVSPRRYLYRRRIELALQPVRDGLLPLAHIAMNLGFSDQSHFTRQFARCIGETPLAYRRRHS